MNSKQAGSTASWVIIGAVIALLVGLFIYNNTHKEPAVNPHTTGGPWNTNMVMGKADAPNKFIQYTDYFCFHCSKVHEARTGTDFKKDYIDSGKVLYEMRIVAMLDTPNTERGAEAAYCAADQQKYWEYTDAVLPKITKDYFDKGIGISPAAPPITLQPVGFYSQFAEAAGMDKAKFEDCVSKEQHKADIESNTQKALQARVTGLPFFVVNDYESSGFGGGYDSIKMIMKAGGVQ